MILDFATGLSGYYGPVQCGGWGPIVGGSVRLTSPIVACSGRRCFGPVLVREPVLVPSVVPPDLSQEGPFDVDQTVSGSLPGC